MAKYMSKCDDQPGDALAATSEPAAAPAAPAAPVVVKSDARAQLREALDNKQQAARALAQANLAVEKSRQCFYDSEDALDALRAAADKPKSPDELVAALSGEGQIDIIELDRPRAEVRAEIVAAEGRVEAWRRALGLSEQAIPARERGLDYANDRVKAQASVALIESVDIPKLLNEAETAARTIVGLRAALRFLWKIAPGDSSQHAAIAEFMGRAWLIDELGDGWQRNPAITPYRQAFEVLLRDQEATIDIAH